MIVASKCGPLARIEKQARVIKTGPTEIFFQNKRGTRINGPQLKIKNYGIPKDLQERSSEIREDFVSNPQLNMI